MDGSDRKEDLVNRADPHDRGADKHRYVSTSQAAEALGVSVTTVKRWVDDGILPAQRTVGKHRKLLLADVQRMVREGNLSQTNSSPAVPTSSPEQNEPERLQEELIRAARDGNTDRVRHLILSGYRNSMAIETLADSVIAPTLHQIGHDWETGSVDVVSEHRATQACVSALYELRALLRSSPEKGRPVAVGGAPEHDHFLLPTLLAKLTLLESGWDAINLGPHTPMSAFQTALDQLCPALIWVSVTWVETPDAFLRDYNAFYHEAEARGVAVVVGGQGLIPELRSRMGYTSFGDRLMHLAAFSRSVYRRPPQLHRGRAQGSGGQSVGTAEANNETADPSGRLPLA